MEMEKMEMNIVLPMLDKSFALEIGYGDSVKSQRNRSLASASPCCEVELKQDKKCGGCGKIVATSEVAKKILKIGKTKIVLPAEQLDNIEDSISQSACDIQVKAVMKKGQFDLPVERIDGIKYTEPAKRRTRDYVELKELLKGHTMIAEAVFKSNSYEVVLTTQGDMIVVVKLATESRLNKKPSLEGIGDITLNPELLKVENAILDKNAVETYDFAQFEDARIKLVDDLIEKVAMGEKLPDIKAVAKKSDVDEADELAKMKALLEGTGTKATA
jgi:hypothetical protein